MLRLATHACAILLVAAMLGSTIPGVRIVGVPVSLILTILYLRDAVRIAPTLVAAARA